MAAGIVLHAAIASDVGCAIVSQHHDMKIVQASCGLLTNTEVLAVLRERGCDDLHPSARSLASEKMVYQHLHQHSPGPSSSLPPAKLAAFLAALKPFKLSRVELLQLINLVPSSVIEVHLIVEGCEERLSEQQINALLEVVAQHLPKEA